MIWKNRYTYKKINLIQKNKYLTKIILKNFFFLSKEENVLNYRKIYSNKE